MPCSYYRVIDPLSLYYKPSAAEGPHLEKQKGRLRKKKEKERINPFLRKISGCPFRVGCGWSSFLSHIFLCQWLDPWCFASLSLSPLGCLLYCSLCSSHPASLPILHRLYGDLLRRDEKYLCFSNMVLLTNLELCVSFR